MKDDTTSAPAPDFTDLRHGDHVGVHSNGNFHYSGYVDDTIPRLNIVWIRELHTGERKMLSTDEYRIVHH